MSPVQRQGRLSGTGWSHDQGRGAGVLPAEIQQIQFRPPAHETARSARQLPGCLPDPGARGPAGAGNWRGVVPVEQPPVQGGQFLRRVHAQFPHHAVSQSRVDGEGLWGTAVLPQASHEQEVGAFPQRMLRREPHQVGDC